MLTENNFNKNIAYIIFSLKLSSVGKYALFVMIVCIDPKNYL